MNSITERVGQVRTPVAAHDGSYVDWSAILAGSVISGAIVSIFTTFGAALGLASISPYDGDGSPTATLLAVGTWMVWTTVSGIMSGAYVAGRMRRRVDAVVTDEISVRDGIRGLAVWGVSVLIGAWLIGAATDNAAAVVAQTAGTAEVETLALAAQNASIVSAFVAAAALFVAAAGAYWAAGTGGRHRDENRVFPRFGTWT